MLERVAGHGPGHKKEVVLRKMTLFVIEKYIEDAKQDEKSSPDLLKSIMRPTRLAKEELRRILFEITQYRPEIIKIRVSTFGCPENRRIPAGGQHSPLAQ